MKPLLTTSALIEAGAGLALLIWPSAVVALLLAVPMVGAAIFTLARISGGGLLALGVACWLMRNEPQNHASKGLINALLIYNVIAVAVLTYAFLGDGLRGLLLWPAVVLHGVMTIWCIWYLYRQPSNLSEN